MASITGGRPAAEVTDRVNAVLSVTEAKLYAVSLTDDHGRKGVATVMVFGKMKSGDTPGIFVLLDNDQMQRELRMASPNIVEAVAKHIAATSAVTDVPDHVLGGLDSGFAPDPAPKRGRKKKTTEEA
jgi:hypothetical protein